MNIQDPLGLVNHASVARLVRDGQLPDIATVRLLGVDDVLAHYRVDFVPGSELLQVQLSLEITSPSQGIGLQTELAARTAMQFLPELPGADLFRLLPPALLGRFAVLRTPFVGVSGQEWLAGAAPGGVERVGDALGTVIAALAEETSLDFGTRGDDARFVARRASWESEWRGHAVALHQTLIAMGGGFGALSDALFEALLSDLPVLSGFAGPWCVVHRRLEPACLRMDPANGNVLAVEGWGFAMAGDPLLEWATMLFWEPALLGAVLRGWAFRTRQDPAAMLLEPRALARLQLYARTACLERLHGVLASELVGNNPRSVLRLQSIADITRRALSPDFARASVEAALATKASMPPGSGLRPDPTLAAVRGALHLFRADPPMLATDALRAVAALGSALLAVDLTGPDEARARGVAIQFVTASLRTGPSAHGEPIRDKDGWLDELARGVLGPIEQRRSGSYTATALLGFAVAALDVLDWTVPDSTLRGLEALLRAVAARDHRMSGVPAEVGRVQLLLGLGGLGLLGGRSRVPEAALVGRTAKLLGDEMPFYWSSGGAHPPPAVAEVGPLLEAGQEAARENLSRPALLRALTALPEGVCLPEPAEALLRGLVLA